MRVDVIDMWEVDLEPVILRLSKSYAEGSVKNRKILIRAC